MSDKKEPKEIKIDQLEQFKVSEQEQETVLGGMPGKMMAPPPPAPKNVTIKPSGKS